MWRVDPLYLSARPSYSATALPTTISRITDYNMGRDFKTILQDLGQGLQQFKSPAELLLTFIYSVPMMGAIRVCVEFGLFEQLSEAGLQNKALSVAEMASKLKKDEQAGSKSDPEDETLRQDLVTRMLRPAVLWGLVDQVGQSSFAANDLTHEMADPAISAGFKLVMDTAAGPSSTINEMYKTFAASGHKAPATVSEGPYQQVRDIPGTSVFQHWSRQEPFQWSRLNLLMQKVQAVRPHWTEWFPKEALFGEQDPQRSPRPFLVDLGAGYGHDLRALTAKYPDEQVSFVLQDLPNVIDECKAQNEANGRQFDSRIKLVAQDFFQPQTVQGAEVYFLHKIFHDFPDRECIQILSRLRDAMAEGSRIFLNDIILPDMNCPPMATAHDITMLVVMNGLERSEEMWMRLVNQVGGLKIVKFWQPPDGDGEGIVEIARG